MTIPVDQLPPYGPYCDARCGVSASDVASQDPAASPHAARAPPPHLTMAELAARWRRTRKTIERRYAEWGLRPLRFGGRLLFPIEQVLEVERRAMEGKFVKAAE
jgi:hypothetical protein